MQSPRSILRCKIGLGKAGKKRRAASPSSSSQSSSSSSSASSSSIESPSDEGTSSEEEKAKKSWRKTKHSKKSKKKDRKRGGETYHDIHEYDMLEMQNKVDMLEANKAAGVTSIKDVWGKMHVRLSLECSRKAKLTRKMHTISKQLRKAERRCFQIYTAALQPLRVAGKQGPWPAYEALYACRVMARFEDCDDIRRIKFDSICSKVAKAELDSMVRRELEASLTMQRRGGLQAPRTGAPHAPVARDTCNHCKQVGHWRRDCPLLNARRGPVVQQPMQPPAPPGLRPPFLHLPPGLMPLPAGPAPGAPAAGQMQAPLAAGPRQG